MLLLLSLLHINDARYEGSAEHAIGFMSLNGDI